MKGNKPGRSIWEEDRVLCCTCHSHDENDFIYGKKQILSCLTLSRLCFQGEGSLACFSSCLSHGPLKQERQWAPMHSMQECGTACVQSGKGLHLRNTQKCCWGSVNNGITCQCKAVLNQQHQQQLCQSWQALLARDIFECPQAIGSVTWFVCC